MKDSKGHGSASRGAMSVPEQHQFKIAKSTLRMPDAMVGVMGGMNKDQARQFLSDRAGWSGQRIAQHEGVSDSQAANALAGGHPKAAPVPVHGGASGPMVRK